MAGEFSNFINEVKSSVDIVDVVSEYVSLKKTGKNHKALCPFHEEKTPSFTVNPANQFFHCFGCDKGGDVYNFLIEIENITFYESLKLLAERAGLEVPNQSSYTRRLNKKREKLFELNKLAARFYNYILQNKEPGKKAREYLNSRGFSGDDIEKYNLGYAPDRWRSLLTFLKKKGYDGEELLKAGLISKSNKNYYDKFRNRIIFPIYNIRGEVLAFGGRIINSKSGAPKYLNSPETLIYNKGENLYGLNWAKSFMRKKESVFIMEGYTDVLMAHSRGIKNVLASLGTSLTLEQAKLLKRYVSTVYIAFDADTAGAKAALRGLDILNNAGLKVKIIELPSNKDPDDIIREEGADKFLKHKKEATGLMDYKIKQILGKKEEIEPEDKILRAKKAAGLVAKIDDYMEKEIFLQKISAHLNLSVEVLKKEIEKNSNKKHKNYENRYNKKDNKINKTNSADSINKLEKKIFKAYLEYPEYRDLIKNELSPSDFTDKSKRLAQFLWKKEEKDFKYYINQIEKIDLKRTISSLFVRENREIDSNMLKEWILKVKELNIYKTKVNIYNKLQQIKEPEPGELNKVFLNFHSCLEIDINWKGGF